MEIRDRSLHYSELVRQKKEENDSYDNKSSSMPTGVSAPKLPNVSKSGVPNMKIPKFY